MIGGGTERETCWEQRGDRGGYGRKGGGKSFYKKIYGRTGKSRGVELKSEGRCV